MAIVLERLVKAIRDSAIHNPDSQVAPFCILWPDGERQWGSVIPRLQAELPELFILGDYLPEKKTGPAIWIRCAIAGKINDILPDGINPPVIYLPGVSRQELRSVESCPDNLKPLAELQYRGMIWSQANSRDWTILAYLKSDQGGLGLEVAQDRDTLRAMEQAINHFLDEDVETLKGKHLDSIYFNTLLTGDLIRDLLIWLDQGDAFRKIRGEEKWNAFKALCKSQLLFDPEKEGPLSGASKLASHEGSWQGVWDRFCEAPHRYKDIPNLIRKCQMPALNLVDGTEKYGGWPQWNDQEEKDLRNALISLSSIPTHEARKKLAELELKHKERRSFIWAEMGEAPLALALEWLAILADITSKSLSAGTMQDIVTGYSEYGWRADDAVLRALAIVGKQADVDAVHKVIRAIYLPWAEESARYLQELVGNTGYPGGTIDSQQKLSFEDSECLLFVDGLRFDLAKRLSDIFIKLNYQTEEMISWAALPTITATGKPAVMPIRNKIHGQEVDADFEPCVADTGKPIKGGYHLQKLLTDSGWVVLGKSDLGMGLGRAWCESEDIDHEGHDRGWEMAKYLDGKLNKIREHIERLNRAGWKRVRIVTDHGWLLMPGGLPKTDLPAALVENKRWRCAIIKPGAICDENLFSWYWNPSQHLALANGISCYRSGEEYAHGGLSLQECLNLEIVVTPKTENKEMIQVRITEVSWKGLRCKVNVEGEFSGLLLDVRKQPGDGESSVVENIKTISDNRTASVVISPEYENLEGHGVWIVIVNDSDQIVAQVDTLVGGGTI